MNEKNLSGIYRTEDFGSSGSRRLLKTGRIPAVIYGKNETVHVSLDEKEFTQKLKHFNESTLLAIKVGKKSYSVLMKDFQENVMLGKILHVDFFEVTSDEVLRTRVTIILQGNPVGARMGGILDQVTHDIEIECLPKDLPGSIIVDVSALELNASIHLSDIAIPENVKVLTPLKTTIASVKSVKEEVVAPVVEAEAAATPAAGAAGAAGAPGAAGAAPAAPTSK
jgi:large subunit ribosomal protein L25